MCHSGGDQVWGKWGMKTLNARGKCNGRAVKWEHSSASGHHQQNEGGVYERNEGMATHTPRETEQDLSYCSPNMPRDLLLVRNNFTEDGRMYKCIKFFNYLTCKLM